MDIIGRDDIQRTLSVDMAIAAVRSGFGALANGDIVMPDPMQILFNDEAGALVGDCHVKAAQSRSMPYFVIKLATGFYNNQQLGLSTNNGMLLALSATTGQPLAILQDGGLITTMRTAAAGALAATLVHADAGMALGVIGTGEQAFMQSRMIAHQTGIRNIMIQGRDPAKIANLCAQLNDYGLSAYQAPDVASLCHDCRILVTTTPASDAVITAADLGAGAAGDTHIIAVGADSPGKNEIDPAIFKTASHIFTDSHEQCLHHGDFGAAVRAGAIHHDADISLPAAIAGAHDDLLPVTGTSIVDLTGLGVQDLYTAGAVITALCRI